MNVSLGMVEWEEGRQSAPGTLGRKLAVALSVAVLTALAMENWLSGPDSVPVRSETPAAELVLNVD